MRVIEVKNFFPVHDPLMIQSKLSEFENELKGEGYQVDRKAFGAVVIRLDDGEVHFAPTGSGIVQILFKKQGGANEESQSRSLHIAGSLNSHNIFTDHGNYKQQSGDSCTRAITTTRCNTCN